MKRGIASIAEACPRMTAASCPDCEYEIMMMTEPQTGLRMTCPYCEAYLEVVSLEPLTLDWVNKPLDEAAWFHLVQPNHIEPYQIFLN